LHCFFTRSSISFARDTSSDADRLEVAAALSSPHSSPPHQHSLARHHHTADIRGKVGTKTVPERTEEWRKGLKEAGSEMMLPKSHVKLWEAG